MNNFIDFILGFFIERKDDKFDEERVENILRPFLGYNPPHYTYQDLKREVVRKLYKEFGKKAPTVYDLKLEICGTYKRVRGLKIKWKDNEYEVGKFELERK